MSSSSTGLGGLAELIPIKSFGAALVGFGVASALCGSMAVQTYIYYKSSAYQTDRWGLKFLVAMIWIMDFFQLITQGHVLFDGLISNYGNPLWFLHPPWSFGISTGLNAFVSCPVQIFYAYRVFILSRRKPWIPLVITVSALASYGFGIATMVIALNPNLLFGEYQRSLWVIDTWLGITIGTDFVITGSSYYYLTRGRTGYRDTDVIIDKLLFLTLNTGLLPSLFELAHLISFTINANNYAHLAFNFVAPKLYANSFMATLNARAFLQQQRSRLGPIEVKQHSVGHGGRSRSGQGVSINVGRAHKESRIEVVSLDRREIFTSWEAPSPSVLAAMEKPVAERHSGDSAVDLVVEITKRGS